MPNARTAEKLCRTRPLVALLENVTGLLKHWTRARAFHTVEGQLHSRLPPTWWCQGLGWNSLSTPRKRRVLSMQNQGECRALGMFSVQATNLHPFHPQVSCLNQTSYIVTSSFILSYFCIKHSVRYFDFAPRPGTSQRQTSNVMTALKNLRKQHIDESECRHITMCQCLSHMNHNLYFWPVKLCFFRSDLLLPEQSYTKKNLVTCDKTCEKKIDMCSPKCLERNALWLFLLKLLLQKVCPFKGQKDQETEVGEETLSEDERIESQDLNSLAFYFACVLCIHLPCRGEAGEFEAMPKG